MSMHALDAAVDHAHTIRYWQGVESTVAGVLGGYPSVSRADLRASQTFIKKLERSKKGPQSSPPADGTGVGSGKLLGRVVDCGAGIGRVTAGCLSRVAATVDMVEPVDKFADVAEALGTGTGTGTGTGDGESGGGTLAQGSRVGTVFRVGLEAWTPEPAAYDLIWNQWCLNHLTDAELVAYLGRCAAGITAGGWIGVKENLSTAAGGVDVYDDEDSGITRSDDSFRRVFAAVGLAVVASELQKGFPKHFGLYPVKMYALRPV